MVSPQQRQQAVVVMRSELAISERRACGLIQIHRGTHRYQRRPEDPKLRGRLRELAEERRRFGYRRLLVLLVREGWQVNHKRVYRLYVEEKLGLRRKRGRRRRAAGRTTLPLLPTAPDQVWTMDFTQDALATGRRFRTLNLMDGFAREALEIEVDTSLGGVRVVRVLEGLKQQGRKPGAIMIDNGPEFVSQVVDRWAYENGVLLHFITPGRPMENGYIESFNGKFRDECLNENWFLDLEDARRKIAEWKRDYNHVRPHSALGYLTPMEFLKSWAAKGCGKDAPWKSPTPDFSTALGNPANNAGFPLSHSHDDCGHQLESAMLETQNPEKVSLSLD
jgi:putative transposase